jgi:hypothetical protein
LKSRPELDSEDVWLFDAFDELHRCRNVAFDVCAITIESMVAWLDLHGICDFETRLFFFDVVSIVDSWWISKQREEMKNARASSSNRRSSRSKRRGPI